MVNLQRGIKAAFIDRDGVINEERHYVHRVEDFVLLPGAAAGLRALSTAGYSLVVITNQAGVAHGYYDMAAVDRLHAHMRVLLGLHQVQLAAIYACPHHPQGVVAAYRCECTCRKPGDGMLRNATADLHLDLRASVLVGDKASDIEAGRRAGVALTALVESGHAIDEHARAMADLVVPSLHEAALAIIQHPHAGIHA